MRLNRFYLAVLVWTLFQGFDTLADVKLPQLIGSGMVLQRDRPLKIWGWADEGEVVSVQFNGTTLRATTDGTRKWSVLLPAQPAGGPHMMAIAGKNSLRLDDVLVGDVWVCSGQSNMELPMIRVIDRYADVIAKANFPQIRQLNVATRYDFNVTQEDLSATRWEAATPQTVLQFTAVGFFFAKALHEKYGVPIGLIKASVGGSPAEAWLSEDALKAFPAYLATAQKLKDSEYVNRIRRTDEATSRAWYTRIGQQDKGRHDTKPWSDPTYDASNWPAMAVPGYWADQGLKGVNGVVWFRREIDVPASMVGQPARLRLGSIVDRDSAFLNGVFVGTTGYQYPPRKYDLPTNLLRAGKNTLVVKVINSTGRGGFYEDKPYRIEAGGQVVDLTGKWQYQVGAVADPLPPSTFLQYQPGGLFRGMVAPLLHTAFKGVIWYQGESNVSNAQEYATLFPAVIADWRKHWQKDGVAEGDFPFLYVQLANYLPAQPQPSESSWAVLREAQLKTLSVPNTGMAVAIDIGEWNDIHPLNKADVGARLARAAQRVAYGDRQVVASGPIYKSMRVKGNKIVLTFNETGTGLISKNGSALNSFAIAGAGLPGVPQPTPFVWANAKIKGNKVVVWSDQVRHPVAVRYAWADNPEGANLYNREGLPASPFRTDH